MTFKFKNLVQFGQYHDGVAVIYDVSTGETIYVAVNLPSDPAVEPSVHLPSHLSPTQFITQEAGKWLYDDALRRTAEYLGL